MKELSGEQPESPPPPERVEWGRELTPSQREQKLKDDAAIAMGNVAIRRPLASFGNIIRKCNNPGVPGLPAQMPPEGLLPPSPAEKTTDAFNVDGIIEGIGDIIDRL